MVGEEKQRKTEWKHASDLVGAGKDAYVSSTLTQKKNLHSTGILTVVPNSTLDVYKQNRNVSLRWGPTYTRFISRPGAKSNR